MSAAWSVAVAAVFVWLGMVLAISFLEAPLKFRAPGVTLQLGLGIGRLVFRALNTCEAVLAAVILVALFLDAAARCGRSGDPGGGGGTHDPGVGGAPRADPEDGRGAGRRGGAAIATRITFMSYSKWSRWLAWW